MSKSDSMLRMGQKFDAGNAIAAAVILADPEKYQGIQLTWAKLWMSRHGGQSKQSPDAVPLAHKVRLAQPAAQLGLFDASKPGEGLERAA